MFSFPVYSSLSEINADIKILKVWQPAR